MSCTETSCTEVTHQDTAVRTAARGAGSEAGALFPPPGFPAGGFGDARRHPTPFADEARPGFPRLGVTAKRPSGPGLARVRDRRGHITRPVPGLPARLGTLALRALAPEPERLAADLAALVAVALVTALGVVLLDVLASGGL